MGFLWLSTVPLTSGIVAEIFGVRYLSMLGGFVFLSHQVGSFLGVWLGGRLYDATGSYDVVWWIAIGLGVFAGDRQPADPRAGDPAPGAGVRPARVVAWTAVAAIALRWRCSRPTASRSRRRPRQPDLELLLSVAPAQSERAGERALALAAALGASDRPGGTVLDVAAGSGRHSGAGSRRRGLARHRGRPRRRGDAASRSARPRSSSPTSRATPWPLAGRTFDASSSPTISGGRSSGDRRGGRRRRRPALRDLRRRQRERRPPGAARLPARPR